jgi:hypothetical protein
MTKPKLAGKVPFDALRVSVAHEFLWMETQHTQYDPLPYSWFVAINVARNAIGRHYTEQPKLIYISRLIRKNVSIPRYVRVILAELIDPKAGFEHWRYHPRKRAGQATSAGSAEWPRRLKSLASELRDSTELTVDARAELAAICDLESKATVWYLSAKRIKNATNKNNDHPIPSGLLLRQRYMSIYFAYRRRIEIPYFDIDSAIRKLSVVVPGQSVVVKGQNNISELEKRLLEKFGNTVSSDQVISQVVGQGKRAPERMTDLEIRGAIADEYDISIDTVNRAIKFGQSFMPEREKDRRVRQPKPQGPELKA